VAGGDLVPERFWDGRSGSRPNRINHKETQEQRGFSREKAQEAQNYLTADNAENAKVFNHERHETLERQPTFNRGLRGFPLFLEQKKTE
jgi:hypothetical protein